MLGKTSPLAIVTPAQLVSQKSSNSTTENWRPALLLLDVAFVEPPAPMAFSILAISSGVWFAKEKGGLLAFGKEEDFRGRRYI
ncbi:hypothetical protein AMTR_s00007p00110480 [Amborella trichopoda]|uniref:Uncharacterized protein n=1 Tax=Amborella trichopoda TaxID=13333 RepID=W1PC38_AMBTC|nr:hypothetical protein AMTR_s00007p00110480 [Amborella trichopoda]